MKKSVTGLAETLAQKKLLIEWFYGRWDLLKDHPPTVPEKWAITSRAFTLSNEELSSEDKWAMFKVMEEADKSDEADKMRHKFEAV